MSANAQLAGIFQEMSAIMELTGANAFRVNAYARAARVLNDLTVDVADIADHKQLVAIEGIGDGTAKKIIEYLDTATVAAHKTLLDEVPHGLLELLKISGLGPKTVRVLWEQGGVTDMPSLIKKLDSGDIEKLPRMGAKTVANIRESIAFAVSSGKRARLGQAMPLAEQIVENLRRVPGTTRVEYAGSLRRGRETIGDIDILASTEHPGALHDAFQTMPGVIKVLVAGETKSSIRLEPGGQVDLRVVDTTTGEISFTRSVEARTGGFRLNLGVFRSGFGGALKKQKRTPAGKAIRAVMVEIVDYLTCAMVTQGDCMAEFDAKEAKRKESLKNTIKLD